MKPGLLIAALVATAATASAAATPSTAGGPGSAFDTFKEVCVVTGGQKAAALAAADFKGWKALPPAQASAMAASLAGKNAPPGSIEGRVDGKAGSVDTLKWALAVGHTYDIKELAPEGDVCVLGMTGQDLASLEAEALRFAAVPATPGLVTKPPATTYAWRDDADGRHALSAPELKSAGRAANVLVVYGTDQVAMIALFKPTK